MSVKTKLLAQFMFQALISFTHHTNKSSSQGTIMRRLFSSVFRAAEKRISMLQPIGCQPPLVVSHWVAGNTAREVWITQSTQIITAPAKGKKTVDVYISSEAHSCRRRRLPKPWFSRKEMSSLISFLLNDRVQFYLSCLQSTWACVWQNLIM